MDESAALLDPPFPARRASLVALGAFVVVAVTGETYAKWWPYAHKVAHVVATHAVGGSSILAKAGAPGAAPSWHAAWSFTVSYGLDIWVALVAAILIGAGVQVLLPRGALTRAFDGRGGWRASVAGGVLAFPCLMCTCCASPITVSLRRAKVPVAGALSYWLGNPLLNPVVLVILALVLPWPYVVVRIAIGVLLVFAAAPLVARLAPSRPAPATGTAAVAALGRHRPGMLRGEPDRADAPPSGRETVRRYGREVLRLAAFLLPEYFVVVLALGAFRGWLLPLDHSTAAWGVGGVAVAAIAGTLLVIPTAAEVPIILGLVAVGLPISVTGALVVALPALSLASMAMVGRWLSWRVTGTMAGVVALAALAAGGLASLL